MIKEQANDYFGKMQELIAGGDCEGLAPSLFSAYLKSMVSALTLGKEEPYDDETKEALEDIVAALLMENNVLYESVVNDEISDYVDYMIDLSDALRYRGE